MIRAIDLQTQDNPFNHWTRRRLGRLPTVVFLLVTFLSTGVGNALGAIIPVTTLQQKISGSGGC